MTSKHKVKAAPIEPPPAPLPLEAGQAIELHGHIITVVENTGGVVKFNYANGERRQLPEKHLNEYRKHDAFPKGTTFERHVNGESVEVKILSIAGGTYGLDIEPFEVDAGLDTTVTFKKLIDWHMQPEGEDDEDSAPTVIKVTAVPFPDRPGYEPDEDTPDYAAGYDAGRKAALAEVVDQSAEVSRLKSHIEELQAELRKRSGFIDILQNEKDMQRRAIEQLEIQVDELDRKAAILSPRKVMSKTICQNISDDALTTEADTQLDVLNSEGWEVAYEIVNCIMTTRKVNLNSDVETTIEERKDIRFVRLTRPVITTIPAPRPSSTVSAGNPTHASAISPVLHTPLNAELDELNAEVMNAANVAMLERLNYYAARPRVTLGGHHVIQSPQ